MQEMQETGVRSLVREDPLEEKNDNPTPEHLLNARQALRGSTIHLCGCVLVAQSCPILCNPMDHIAHQVPLSMGFFRPEYCSGLPFPSAGDLPNPGTEPGSPALPADSL